MMGDWQVNVQMGGGKRSQEGGLACSCRCDALPMDHEIFLTFQSDAISMQDSL